jgi:hypothetical protein
VWWQSKEDSIGWKEKEEVEKKFAISDCDSLEHFTTRTTSLN